MKTYRRNLIPITAVGILAVIGYVISNSRPAVAQNPKPGSAPVNIVSPLPLPVTGDVGITTGSGIQITNPANNPVLVQEVGGEIVSRVISVGLGGGAGACNSADIIMVPAGKRLVIEHVSSRSILSAPNRLVDVALTHTGLSDDAIVTTAPMFTIPVAGFNEDIVSQPMHIYSDTSVQACVGLTSQTSDSVKVVVSGYFINRP